MTSLALLHQVLGSLRSRLCLTICVGIPGCTCAVLTVPFSCKFAGLISSVLMSIVTGHGKRNSPASSSRCVVPGDQIRSVPTFSQRRLASIGMRVSFSGGLARLWLALQSSAICFIFADIPGQNMHTVQCTCNCFSVVCSIGRCLIAFVCENCSCLSLPSDKIEH